MPGPSYRLLEQRFLIPADGTYFVRVTSGGGASDYTIRNVLLRSTSFESESNNVLADANPLGSNTGIAGTVNPAADVDWYSFTAESGEHVQIDCHGGQAANSPEFLRDLRLSASALQPVVTITDSGGTPISSSSMNVVVPKAHGNVSVVSSVSVSFVAPAAGTFYVNVTDAGASGGASHHYQLIRR